MSDDFLAREQAILGDTFSPSGLNGASSGGDIDFAASAFPDLDDFDGDAVAPPPVHSSASFGNGLDAGFGDFETVPSFPGVGATPVTDVKVTGDDEVDRFESEFPDIGTSEFAPPQQTYQPQFLANAPQRPSFQTPAYEPEEEEPEVVRQWRLKQQEEISARDEAASRKKQATIEKAHKDIDDYYTQYNAGVARQIQKNKDNEAEFLEKQTSALSAGTTWSRIADTLELGNSQSKTIARAGPGTTDLTRYKEVLLRLMREGENAPGAAGY